MEESALASAVRSFTIALRARNQSPRTASAHMEAVTAFSRQFSETEWTRDHCRLFLANPRWSGATRLLRWKGLKAFFEFCLLDGLLDVSPLEGVPRPKAGQGRRPPKYEEADIERLLEACNETGVDGRARWIGLRDQAIILTLGTTPARIAELCGLLVTDVDFDGQSLRFRHAKGDVEYRAVLFPQTARAYDRYLRARPFDIAALWVGRDGEAMQVHTVQMMLRRLKNKTGMTKPLYAHAWRHNWGMRTVEWGLAVDETAKTMGQRSTKAAEIYRQWVAEEAALAKIRRIAG